MSKNPATATKVPRPGGAPARCKVWSSEEARQFLESARADNDPLYAGYALVLALGLCKGDVLGLVW